MTTNITSKFIQGTGVAVTTEGDTRILAIHAFSTVNGTFDIEDSKLVSLTDQLLSKNYHQRAPPKI